MNSPKDIEKNPDAMISKALTHAGLGDQYAAMVREYVKRPDPSWRQCCSGGCIPCVDQIGLAVDYLRERGFGEDLPS
jgi:hypothetical protein